MEKAYIARASDDWCGLVHGETPGKAKSRFCANSILESWDFLAVRLRRIPGLDDKPITYENAKAAGFEFAGEEGEPLDPKYFENDCSCEICKKGGEK